MGRYLISVLRPHGYDHAASLPEAARREIDALNDEMVMKGVRVFVGGLRPPSTAKCVQIDDGRSPVVSAGIGIEAPYYLDGFWVLDCSTEEDAVMWATKASAACRASIEIRPFY